MLHDFLQHDVLWCWVCSVSFLVALACVWGFVSFISGQGVGFAVFVLVVLLRWVLFRCLVS